MRIYNTVNTVFFVRFGYFNSHYFQLEMDVVSPSVKMSVFVALWKFYKINIIWHNIKKYILVLKSYFLRTWVSVFFEACLLHCNTHFNELL